MIQSEQMQQQQKTPETKNKEGSDCKVFKAGYLLGPNITCLFVKTKIWNTFDMPTLKTLIKEATKLSQDKSPREDDINTLFDQVESMCPLSAQDIKKSGIVKLISMISKKCTHTKNLEQGKRLVSTLKTMLLDDTLHTSTRLKRQMKEEKSKGIEKATNNTSCPSIVAEVFDHRGELPTRNKHGELVFKDAPKFRPNLTPDQVLKAGAFGGGYFRNITSRVTGKKYSDPWKEFPSDWFTGIDIPTMVSCKSYTELRNKYRVKCGADKDYWEQKGWMSTIDPYGWFQWRSSDDERQISRANKCFGETGRWRINLCNKIMRAGAEYNDPRISPVVRQTLLHWGYELTERDYLRHLQRQRAKTS
eukprot:gene1340-4518_t